MESPYVVVRDATPTDLFKILVDTVFPNVDVKNLANGKILQVAEDKLLGVILGFIVFDNGELKRTGYGHITSLFVNHIFRRKGHATRLVTNAEMDLDKQGAAYVSVSFQKTDTDAFLFFKKMGYEEAVTSNNIYGNDDANVIMTKKLKGKQFYSAEAEGSAPNKPHKVMAACLDGEEEENANVTSKMLKKQQMHPVETEGSAPNESHAVKAAYLDGEEEEDANVKSKMLKKRQMHPVETEGDESSDEDETRYFGSACVKIADSYDKGSDEFSDANETRYFGSAFVKIADSYDKESDESSDEDETRYFGNNSDEQSDESSYENEKPASKVVQSKNGSALAKKADSSDEESSDEDEGS